MKVGRGECGRGGRAPRLHCFVAGINIELVVGRVRPTGDRELLNPPCEVNVVVGQAPRLPDQWQAMRLPYNSTIGGLIRHCVTDEHPKYESK
jgi:hypothetical protein